MKKFKVSRQFGFEREFYLVFAFLILVFCPNIFAQTEYPANAAMPPIKSLPKDDKEKLEAEKDVKKRLNLAISMMDNYLKNAEMFNADEDYMEMFKQFGYFHATMDNTLNFLERNNTGRGKILNYYKRFEMTLRGFLSRIEIIRRELPPRYEFYVRTLAKAVRDARTRSVEPLFDNRNVPNQS